MIYLILFIGMFGLLEKNSNKGGKQHADKDYLDEYGVQPNSAQARMAYLNNSELLFSDLENDIQKTEIVIYPNPVIDNLTVETTIEGDFILYNSLGQIVLDQKITFGQNNFDIRNLKIGLYSYYIKSNDKIVSTGKLSIQ
jgi:hypothetical protein